jgi:hypothetical protein
LPQRVGEGACGFELERRLCPLGLVAAAEEMQLAERGDAHGGGYAALDSGPPNFRPILANRSSVVLASGWSSEVTLEVLLIFSMPRFAACTCAVTCSSRRW